MLLNEQQTYGKSVTHGVWSSLGTGIFNLITQKRGTKFRKSVVIKHWKWL